MEEQIEKVERYLEDKIELEKNCKAPPKPCIILYKGKRIKLKKYIWNSKGSARSSFSNSINYIVGYRNNPKLVREEMERRGDLIFKEI